MASDGRCVDLEYNPQVDAAYIRLVDSQITDSEEVRPGVVLDYSAKDRVVEIEMRNFRQQVPNFDLTQFGKEAG